MIPASRIAQATAALKQLALAAALLLNSTSVAASEPEAWTMRYAPTGPATVSSYEDYMVGEPPASLGLDPYYRKYVDADGIPIISSGKVDNSALLIARDIVNAMLSMRPDIRAELAGKGARVGIMAIDEGIMDLPEMRSWTKPGPDDPRLTRCEREFYHQVAAMTDREYWNERARGIGGLFTTSGAEMLLGTPGTRYFGENILVHEFSHNILTAIETVDPVLYSRIEKAYAQAKERGLWQYGYAIVTVQEYWAEGSQFWFNTNDAYKHGDVVVLSSQDMEQYDPALASVLREVYGDRHRIAADVFHNHPARLAHPPIPEDGTCKSMWG